MNKRQFRLGGPQESGKKRASQRKGCRIKGCRILFPDVFWRDRMGILTSSVTCEKHVVSLRSLHYKWASFMCAQRCPTQKRPPSQAAETRSSSNVTDAS